MATKEAATEKKPIIVPDFAIGVKIEDGQIHSQAVFSLSVSLDDTYIKEQHLSKSIVAYVRPLNKIINFFHTLSYRFGAIWSRITGGANKHIISNDIKNMLQEWETKAKEDNNFKTYLTMLCFGEDPCDKNIQFIRMIFYKKMRSIIYIFIKGKAKQLQSILIDLYNLDKKDTEKLDVNMYIENKEYIEPLIKNPKKSIDDINKIEDAIYVARQLAILGNIEKLGLFLMNYMFNHSSEYSKLHLYAYNEMKGLRLRRDERDFLKKNINIYLTKDNIHTPPRIMKIYEIITLPELNIIESYKIANKGVDKKNLSLLKANTINHLLNAKYAKYSKKTNIRMNPVSKYLDDAISILLSIDNIIEYTDSIMNRIPAYSHIIFEYSLKSFGRGALHHAIYIGNESIAELVTNVIEDKKEEYIIGTIVIDELYNFMTRAAHSISRIYIYEYENPYSNDTLAKRMMWSLGTMIYRIADDNCETYINWLCTNKMENQHVMLTKDANIDLYSGVNTPPTTPVVMLTYKTVTPGGHSFFISLFGTLCERPALFQRIISDFNLTEPFHAFHFEQQLRQLMLADITYIQSLKTKYLSPDEAGIEFLRKYNIQYEDENIFMETYNNAFLNMTDPIPITDLEVNIITHILLENKIKMIIFDDTTNIFPQNKKDKEDHYLPYPQFQKDKEENDLIFLHHIINDWNYFSTDSTNTCLDISLFQSDYKKEQQIGTSIFKSKLASNIGTSFMHLFSSNKQDMYVSKLNMKIYLNYIKNEHPYLIDTLHNDYNIYDDMKLYRELQKIHVISNIVQTIMTSIEKENEIIPYIGEKTFLYLLFLEKLVEETDKPDDMNDEKKYFLISLNLYRSMYSESKYSILYKLHTKQNLTPEEITRLHEYETIHLTPNGTLIQPTITHIYEIISLAELNLRDRIEHNNDKIVYKKVLNMIFTKINKHTDPTFKKWSENFQLVDNKELLDICNDLQYKYNIKDPNEQRAIDYIYAVQKEFNTAILDIDTDELQMKMCTRILELFQSDKSDSFQSWVTQFLKLDEEILYNKFININPTNEYEKIAFDYVKEATNDYYNYINVNKHKYLELILAKIKSYSNVEFQEWFETFQLMNSRQFLAKCNALQSNINSNDPNEQHLIDYINTVKMQIIEINEDIDPNEFQQKMFNLLHESNESESFQTWFTNFMKLDNEMLYDALMQIHPTNEYETIVFNDMNTIYNEYTDLINKNLMNIRNEEKEEIKKELLKIKQKFGTKHNVRNNTVSKSIDNAIAMLYSDEHILNLPKILLERIPAFSHIAYEFSTSVGGGFLHHAIYIGYNTIIDVTYEKINDEFVGGCNIRTLTDFLTVAKNRASNIYIFEYNTPYTRNEILKRAMWGLGTLEYKINNNNCETFVNWVFTNKYETQQSIIQSISHIPHYSGQLLFEQYKVSKFISKSRPFLIPSSSSPLTEEELHTYTSHTKFNQNDLFITEAIKVSNVAFIIDKNKYYRAMQTYTYYLSKILDEYIFRNPSIPYITIAALSALSLSINSQLRIKLDICYEMLNQSYEGFTDANKYSIVIDPETGFQELFKLINILYYRQQNYTNNILGSFNPLYQLYKIIRETPYTVIPNISEDILSEINDPSDIQILTYIAPDHVPKQTPMPTIPAQQKQRHTYRHASSNARRRTYRNRRSL